MARHRLTEAFARRAKHLGTKGYVDVADTDLRGFFLRVARSGTRSWFVRHKSTGKREFFGTWPELGADKARERAIELRRGTPSSPTMARLVEHYRAHYMTAAGRRPDSSSHTRARLRLIVASLGALELGQIKPDAIRRMLGSKSDFPVEQNRTLELLSSLYSYAEVEGWHVGQRPTRAVRRNPETPRNRRVLPTERAALLDAMRAIATPVPRGVIDLTAEYGARVSEICRLRWADVLPDRLIISSSKTGTSRALPITKLASRVLEERRVAGHSLEWVFAPSPGKGPIGYDSVWKWWNKARKAAGITDVCIHDLRHERATHWLQSGVPIGVVAKLAGHKDVRTTLGIYQDVVDQDVFDVFRREGTHADIRGPADTSPTIGPRETCDAQTPEVAVMSHLDV